jgi:hypothetical protein
LINQCAEMPDIVAVWKGWSCRSPTSTPFAFSCFGKMARKLKKYECTEAVKIHSTTDLSVLWGKGACPGTFSLFYSKRS